MKISWPIAWTFRSFVDAGTWSGGPVRMVRVSVGGPPRSLGAMVRKSSSARLAWISWWLSPGPPSTRIRSIPKASLKEPSARVRSTVRPSRSAGTRSKCSDSSPRFGCAPSGMTNIVRSGDEPSRLSDGRSPVVVGITSQGSGDSPRELRSLDRSAGSLTEYLSARSVFAPIMTASTWDLRVFITSRSFGLPILEARPSTVVLPSIEATMFMITWAGRPVPSSRISVCSQE